MRISVRVISKVTGKVVEDSLLPRTLLEISEDELIEKLTRCDCSPIPETYDFDCACYDEWEDCELLIGDEVIQ